MTQRHVLNETLLLVLLCTLDLASTIYLLHQGLAREANPVLAWSLAYGYEGFAMVKMATYVVPLTICEMLRDSRPAFIQSAVRMGLVGYVGVYVVMSVVVNSAHFGF